MKTACFVVILFGAALSAAAVGDDKPAAAPVKVSDVWVVFKTHFDLGFTDLAENVFTRYRVEMMDNALKIIERNRNMPAEKRFTWTVPGWPLYAQILGPKQEPARRAAVERAIREGYLAVHALAATSHTESLDAEDLVRSLGFSSKVARTYGRPLPLGAKMTDVPEHSWILATILARGGVKLMQIGCNDDCQTLRVPPLFWWEGPDGSRVLCNCTPSYGSGIGPPADWPAKNYLAMIMEGDNHGPPTPKEVDDLLRQAERGLKGVRVHFGTLDDFVHAIEAEKPNLPVVRGDGTDTWIHGIMSMPQTTKIARNIRPLEPALDALDTHLRAWGLAPGPLAQPLAAAYENSYLYGEHTWGMNSAYGPCYVFGDAWKKWLAEAAAEKAPANGNYANVPNGSKQKWLKSYDDKREYIRKTERIVSRELRSRLDLLAKSVHTDGRRVVVYNPLPWTRSGQVSVTMAGGKAGGVIGLGSGDVAAGDWNGKQYSFFARGVPACGYKAYRFATAPEVIVRGPQTALSGVTLDTSGYKAVFDLRRGGIASLVEKSTGRELVDQSSPYVLGQFLHERFSQKEATGFYERYRRYPAGWMLDSVGKPGMPDAAHSPHLATTPGEWKMATRATNLADVVTLTAGDTKGLAKSYVLKFAFPRYFHDVEVEWQVVEKTASKIPEGGWLCFPLAAKSPRFTVGRPGAPIDPTKDILPGANRHLMAIATGVAITGSDGAGAAVCPLDSPLVSLDNPGLWRWSLDFVPKKPIVFVNLYNNQFNTNFPLWQDGSWSERVRVWPIVAEAGAAESLAVNSWEARTPLLAAVTDGPAGELPPSRPGLTVSRRGALATAFGADPDGNPGTLLRVWDQIGISGDVVVALPGGMKCTAAQPMNLRGEKTGAALKIEGGKFAFRLGAYAPASFLLLP